MALFDLRRLRSSLAHPLISSALVLLFFLFLVAPSVVAFTPYRMAWDEYYLFHNAICFHNAVYDLNLRAMANCYAGLSKSPVLTFMTLPWGPAASTESAIPLAMIGLAILIWMVILLSYYAARLAGASPGVLLLAAAAIWWNPFLASYGGYFLSDILLGWIVLLLLLMIPLELRSKSTGTGDDLLRGLLWGFVVLIGVLTKVTFGLFLAGVGAAVIWLRIRRSGLPSCARAVAMTFVCALPGLIIWAIFGKNFMEHAVSFSFGGLAKFHSYGTGAAGYLRQYVIECARGIVPTALLAGYFAWNWRRSDHAWWRLAPVALVLGYLLLCAFSPNNEDYRFAMPVMIGLPFLLAVLPAAGVEGSQPAPVLLCLGLLAGTLCSIPMLSRTDLSYLRYAGDVLAPIMRPGVKILLATDDPFLNVETFLLANEIHSRRVPGVVIDTLVYDSLRGLTFDASLHRLEGADYLIFRKPPLSQIPKWANQYAAPFLERASQIGDVVNAPSETMQVFKVRH